MKPKFIILIATLLILAVLASIILSNFTVYKTQIFNRATLFPGGSKNINNNCLKTEAIITAKPIHSGDLIVMLSNPVNLEHPAYAGIKDRQITVPVFAYLVHHEKYGYYLIDSGCEESYVGNPYGPMKGLLVSKVVPQTLLNPDNAIEKQLSDVLDEINGVFFTHLHFDHTSGLPALPCGLDYFAGKNEQSFNIKWLLEANHFKNYDVIYQFDFESNDAQELSVGKAIDVFGDYSFWAISTSGHSKGHVSYLVNTSDHPVLIAGDACITNKNLEKGVGSGTSSGDRETDQNTVEKIKEFIDSHSEIEVWPGHDYPKGFVVVGN